MEHFLNAMKAHAVQALDGKVATRLGVVESFDPNTYSVKVTLQPDGASTGWIPVGSPWVGNGWGLFTPPSPGDQVEVGYQEGDRGAPIARQRLFDASNVPLPCPSGEFWLVHQSGSLLKFHNDGSVELHANTSINSSAAAWNHSGPVNITGKVTVTGDVVASGDISDHTNKSMAGMRSTYNGHTHTDPQGGSVSTPNAGM